MRSDPNLPEELRNNSDKWLQDDSFHPTDRSKYRLSFSGGERDHLFVSSQGKRFTDVYGISGLDSPSDGRGCAILDYDRDGQPDLAVVNSNTPRLSLFHNEVKEVAALAANLMGDAENFLAVRLVGGNREPRPSSEFSARDAYGAMVRIETGDLVVSREHRCGEGFAAENSAMMLIGVGAKRRLSSVSIRWPAGGQLQISDVPAGSLLTAFENPADGGDKRGVAIEPYTRPMALVRHAPSAEPRSRFKVNFVANERVASNPHPPAKLRMYTTMATWCPSCKKHLPQVATLRAAFDSEALDLIGLPVDPNDTPEMLGDYVAAYHPAYQLIDSLSPDDRAALDAVLANQVKSDVLPATIITNSDGEILYASTGMATVSELRRLADQQ